MSHTASNKSVFSTPQLKLAFASIGVVFGDIGTSPLYTMREALRPVVSSGTDIPTAVVSVASLLVWALVLIVTLKYVILMMRADNRGEGGILSLVILVESLLKRKGGVILGLGIVGAAFFFGDAMITPAISVLSAVEGLEIINPAFQRFVLPITLVVLITLFVFQYRGTAGIAKFFAPATMAWFIVLTVMGVENILLDPSIFKALNPVYGISLIVDHPQLALLVMGGVFLAVTGGEALYADMGHFGKGPIRMAWSFIVFPALALNYLGQGAFIIANPKAIENPFFQMVPGWALVPLVILATIVTIIASQAVISGAFSTAQQAIALGIFPRMNVIHTSETESGQIYIGQINWLVMIGVVLLVLVFKSSDNLADAYGVAVNMTMIVNTALAIIFFWKVRTLPVWLVVPALGVIFLVESSFLAANAFKIPTGGYMPLLIGGTIIMLMVTWRKGIRLLTERLKKESIELNGLLESLERHPPSRVAGAAVFMQTDHKYAPSALMHNLKHNRVLHDKLIFLKINTVDQPRWEEDRVSVTHGPLGAYLVEAKFGYMEQPDVPAALRACASQDLEVDPAQASYFLGRRVIKVSARSAMPFWQQRIFIALANQSTRAIEFFRLPANRVVELGMQMSL